MEKNFLREYKSYRLFSTCPFDGMDNKGLFEVETLPGSVVYSSFYDPSDPTSINKAIEKGKQWVNNKLKEPVVEKKEPERTCRVCGCTELDCSQCIAKTGQPCHWVEEDLCSACQQSPKEEPQIKVTDTRASQIETLSATIKNDDMNFFQQLGSHLGDVDLTMRIFKKNGRYVVGITPGNKVPNFTPINISGTPEEMDTEFFEAIIPKVKQIVGLQTNIDEVKKKAEEEATEKKKQDDKKKNKPAAKKEKPKTGKKKEPAKKQAVKEEKLAEQSMFDQAEEITAE